MHNSKSVGLPRRLPLRILQQWLLVSAVVLCVGMPAALAYEPETLEIGKQAPDFDLLGTDDKRYSLASFEDKSLLMVIFTTNHCPDCIASYQRMLKLIDDHSDNVAFVAINGSDPKAVRLDEMRWTQHDDTYESMKIVADEYKFSMPYLYDGETQEVTKAYGAVATPHVFLFDKERRLQYTGRLDNGRRNPGPASKSEARDAIEAMLAGKPVPVATTRVFGCSTKWSDKRGTVAKAEKDWNEREVTLASADAQLVKQLVTNETEAIRLINVWSTSCGPCLEEFPSLVQTYRRYQNHPFELITISIDSPEQRESVEKVLQRNHAAVARKTVPLLEEAGRETNNFLFTGDDLEDLADALDVEWSGAQPGGKILFRHTGALEFDALRAAVVKYVHANYLK